MMEELKKVLEESYCLENGFFWTDFQDATRLHTSRSSTDAEKANIVRKLYKNYIQAGAPRELNLHGGTSAALTKAYKANRLTIESFEPVRAEVFTMLYMNRRVVIVLYLDCREKNTPRPVLCNSFASVFGITLPLTQLPFCFFCFPIHAASPS